MRRRSAGWDCLGRGAPRQAADGFGGGTAVLAELLAELEPGVAGSVAFGTAALVPGLRRMAAARYGADISGERWGHASVRLRPGLLRVAGHRHWS